MRIAISQPTYLSWIGYFGMIDLVDTFVVYDDVQFEKCSWQSRNRVKTANGSPIWLSVPSMREELDSKIYEIRLKNYPDWAKKHWLTIDHSYLKAPYFKQYKNDIESIYTKQWEYLSDLNIEIIKTLATLLGVNMPRFVKSSEIGGLVGQKTDRVISVLDKLGADEYISTEGTKVYLEVDKFKQKGIKLYWYEYKHPVYPQINGDFIPYLSAIDLLFNTGERALGYIREGLGEALIPAF